jgi:hypothetical protein
MGDSGGNSANQNADRNADSKDYGHEISGGNEDSIGNWIDASHVIC